jgi:hypothetical protein
MLRALLFALRRVLSVAYPLPFLIRSSAVDNSTLRPWGPQLLISMIPSLPSNSRPTLASGTVGDVHP